MGADELRLVPVPSIRSRVLYFYLSRVINAVIAGTLVAEFDLDAAQLGVLTSIDFLGDAVVGRAHGLSLRQALDGDAYTVDGA
jgi:hypothetical protein